MPTVKKNDAADRRVISILVDNQRGVLARVEGAQIAAGNRELLAEQGIPCPRL